MCESKLPFPTVESQLRHNILKIPPEVYSASGIVINGRRIKSFVFTTDLAIIRNCDAGRGVRRLSLYPAAGHQRRHHQGVLHSGVLRRGRRNHQGHPHGLAGQGCGMSGSHGRGAERADLRFEPAGGGQGRGYSGHYHRHQGGYGYRGPASGGRVHSQRGRRARTPDEVRSIREKNQQVPVIASGGKTGDSIRETIAAGANAITFTPPSTQELFKEMMERYRE